jgi:superfamily II DNA/RNA helicase
MTMTPTRVVDALTFAELGVPAAICAILTSAGIVEPFPIQSATIPDALAGRDVLGRGKTGSGKTMAFGVPTVARLAASTSRRQPSRPRALVLVPTRELANQVAETLIPIAAAMGLKVTTVYGGVGQGRQIAALRAGIDILVACPGRLEDLIGQRHCDLDRVEITVIDEADHMADLGFLPGVKRLLDRTPAGGQRLLFSATLDNGIDVLVKRYLVDQVTHSVDPPIAPVSTMTHHVFAVSTADKPMIVRELAQGRDRALLFTRTKHGAKKIAKQLSAVGIPAVEMHGNLTQPVRERNLHAFTTGSSKVLVATDIAARGIHVDDIALVVHVDPPAEHKAFTHRSGRTARAGASGVVVTLMTPDQVKDVKALARAARVEPIITRITPGHPLLTELVGSPAERRAVPVERPATDRPSTPRPAGARPGGDRRRPSAAPAGGRQPSYPSGKHRARRPR